MHGQNDTRCHFLHEMTSFDETAVGIIPTSSNGEPMLKDHGHQFGRDLTEDPHALLAEPAIELAVLFPQFPDQLDLPPEPQQHSSLQGAEPGSSCIGQKHQSSFEPSMLWTGLDPLAAFPAFGPLAATHLHVMTASFHTRLLVLFFGVVLSPHPDRPAADKRAACLPRPRPTHQSSQQVGPPRRKAGLF